MVCSIQRENGCVPAATMRLPCDSATSTSAPRNRHNSARTSSMFAQTWLPTSICDIINSSLTWSCRRTRPSGRILDTYESSARLSASIIWYSSSTPSVNGTPLNIGSPIFKIRRFCVDSCCHSWEPKSPPFNPRFDPKTTTDPRDTCPLFGDFRVFKSVNRSALGATTDTTIGGV
jgi:hypothetical protein